MPLGRYGALAARAIDRRSERGTDTPPYQMHVRAARAPAGSRSMCFPNSSLRDAYEAFHHAMLPGWPGLPEGFTSLPSSRGMNERSPAWRNRIEVVTIDPSAAFKRAITEQ